MSYLKLPSQKILAKHLRCCTATQETAGREQSIWKCQLGHRSFTVSPSVWIQGTVVQVSDCGSKVIVDDGTGIVILSDCDKVCSKVMLTKGMYVMAVGSLQSGEECPVMVPIKLQDLSSIDHAETLWPLEVIDQLNFLKS
ncbi:unnamed protein product [Candidula unifasciata]|uniref:RecQ-mediated genome instability protein 2 n=1 Tax=Candidula unifasciata TaxID=100452 RepID=A0A8S3ZUV2_9EUPU|nr:unnamed protein product [Candidula unifasciata]